MGPRSPTEALTWIQEAVAAGRYITHPHLHKRFRDRGISLADVRRAVALATSCSEYTDRQPLAAGTSWRIVGPGVDDETIIVGVEAFLDPLGRRALLITVF